MKSCVIILVVLVVASSSFGDAVRFAVQVIDEQTALPVSGVEVSGGFKTDRGFWDSDRYAYEYKQYVTGESGSVTIRGTSNCGEAGWAVDRAAGYYYPVHGSGVPRFCKKNFIGVWQPDNLVVTIKLQRVEHPIPLWVKNIQDTSRMRDLFEEGKDRIQFDFFEGDWLPPVGKGKVADVEFVRMLHDEFGEAENAGIKAKSYRNSMSVKFLGADNGLLEIGHEPYHKLKIRTAPESGYKQDFFAGKGEIKNLSVRLVMTKIGASVFAYEHAVIRMVRSVRRIMEKSTETLFLDSKTIRSFLSQQFRCATTSIPRRSIETLSGI